jgi:hypothetical protein
MVRGWLAELRILQKGMQSGAAAAVFRAGGASTRMAMMVALMMRPMSRLITD